MTVIPLAITLLAAQPPSAQHASLLNMRGESAAARAEIAAVLADHPKAPSALFAAACFALEAGALDDARKYAAALRNTKPVPPHTDVLEALIERRVQVPNEPIDQALAVAWTTAGRPDLSCKPLLPGMESWGTLLPKLTPEAVKGMTAGERLLLANEADATSLETLKLALEAARTVDANPLVVNVEVLGLIGHRDAIPPALEAEVEAAVSTLGPRVVAADGGNGYLALAAWLATGRADQPLGNSDLELLERAAAQLRFAVPRAAMFAELKKMATRIDPRFGALRAQSAALGTSVPLMRLSKRADATKEPLLRRRAGRALMTVATRLQSSGMLLERMLAAALEAKGATLAGDADQIAKASDRTARTREWYRAMTSAAERLGTWPFGGPWRDWEPDHEVEHFGRLAEPTK